MSERESPEPAAALRAAVSRFPDQPGVYLMRDAHGKILYVGKAGNLRRRVAASFTAGRDTRPLVPLLVERVRDIEYLVTTTGTEALILENNLIKRHRPAYNVRLKDDKTYLSLKVTTAEAWPRVLTVRRYADDGSVYFGPYASAQTPRTLIRLIKEIFTLRTCAPGFFRGRTRPCIQYEIGRCCAPCVGLVTPEHYAAQVADVLALLRGHTAPARTRLTRLMQAASAELKFEHAAALRDRLAALAQATERQAAHQLALGDLDVFGVTADGAHVTIQTLFVRDGRVQDAAPFHLSSRLSTPETLASFLAQFYLAGRDVPPEIVVPELPDDHAALANVLRERRGGRVRLLLGRRGERRALLELAARNAREAAQGRRRHEERRRAALEALAHALALAAPPARIECFDISTTGGALAVGSMAVMIHGEPDPSRYRRYRIRTVPGMDDCAMIEEVIARRLGDEAPPPDLLLVDGGKGQVARAAQAVAAHAGAAIPVAGIAKRRRRGGARTTERIFLAGAAEPVALAEDTPASRLLQELRDEAHRFAIAYHRALRSQNSLTGGLENVKGLGKRRIRTLFEKIGGVHRMCALSREELARQGELPAAVAAALHAYLHGQDDTAAQTD